jgi:YD repeat-containing protein
MQMGILLARLKTDSRDGLYWNQEKRLVAVQTPAGENISYAYDGDGVMGKQDC